MAKVLSFSEFLATDGIDYVEVPIRGGDSVRLGSITAEDFAAWTELRESGPEGRKTSGALLICRSLVDENGVRVGNEAQLAQVQKMNLKTTETLLKAIFKLNGINQQDEAAAKKG